MQTVPLGSPEGIPDSLTSSPAPENQIASVLLGRKEIRQMDVAYELAFNHEMADRAQEWSRTDSFRLDECRAYVRNLVRQGGPEPCDYHHLNTWLEEIHRAFRNGEITSKDVDMLREEFGAAFSLETM